MTPEEDKVLVERMRRSAGNWTGNTRDYENLLKLARTGLEAQGRIRELEGFLEHALECPRRLGYRTDESPPRVAPCHECEEANVLLEQGDEMKPSEQARKAAREVAVAWCDAIEWGGDYPKDQDIAQIIEDAMQPEWISTRDGLPEQSRRIWAADAKNKTVFQTYADHIPSMTHWQYVVAPPPPKENSDETL